MSIQPFDPGRKCLSEYAPRELLWGAECQARAAADEYRAAHYDCLQYGDNPPVQYVAIDVGEGGSVLVAYEAAGNKVGYYFAKAQLCDDGDPSNDLVLLGQSEGFSIALLALKTRLSAGVLA